MMAIDRPSFAVVIVRSESSAQAETELDSSREGIGGSNLFRYDFVVLAF
jgi:hypothetical protein